MGLKMKLTNNKLFYILLSLLPDFSFVVNLLYHRRGFLFIYKKY